MSASTNRKDCNNFLNPLGLLPQILYQPVQEGCGLFLKFHHSHLFDQYEGNSNSIVSLSASGWCNEYWAILSRICLFDDKGVEAFVKFYIAMLKVHEIPLDAINGSIVYLQCFRDIFTDHSEVTCIRETLHAAVNQPKHPGISDEEWEDILTIIIITFFSGFFEETEQFLHLLECYFSKFLSENAFSKDIKDLFGEFFILLSEGFQSQSEFEKWQLEANNLVLRARFLLDHDDVLSEDDDLLPSMNRKQSNFSQDLYNRKSQFEKICLSFLLIMSGDAATIHKLCVANSLDSLVYLAGLCSLHFPFLSLEKFGTIFSSFIQKNHHSLKILNDANQYSPFYENQPILPMPWFMPAISSLFSTKDITDLLYSLIVFRDSLVSYILLLDSKQNSGHDKNSEKYVLHFCGFFMLAHLADVCSPYLVTTFSNMELIFLRHEFIISYMNLFSRNVVLWPCAAKYMTLCPLSDPTILYDILYNAGKWAIMGSNSLITFQYLELFVSQYLDSFSIFQSRIRTYILSTIEAPSENVSCWLKIFDEYTKKILRELNLMIIETKFGSKFCVSEALWYSGESGEMDLLKDKLNTIIPFPHLHNKVLLPQIGKAMLYGFISLSSQSSSHLVKLLSFCSLLTVVMDVFPDLIELSNSENRFNMNSSSFMLSSGNEGIPNLYPLHACCELLANGNDYLDPRLLLSILEIAINLIYVLINTYGVSVLDIIFKNTQRSLMFYDSVSEGFHGGIVGFLLYHLERMSSHHFFLRGSLKMDSDSMHRTCEKGGALLYSSSERIPLKLTGSTISQSLISDRLQSLRYQLTHITELS